MRLWLVRHAHAGDRHHWDGLQDERPLSSRGRAQADGVTLLLAHEAVDRVLSSPATRCQQTVHPLATKLGLPMEVEPSLYEGADGERVLALLDGLDADGVVVCSHGDVIPNVLRALRGRGLDLPSAGACEKGSTWAIELRDDQVLAAAYHPPTV